MAILLSVQTGGRGGSAIDRAQCLYFIVSTLALLQGPVRTVANVRSMPIADSNTMGIIALAGGPLRDYEVASPLSSRGSSTPGSPLDLSASPFATSESPQDVATSDMVTSRRNFFRHVNPRKTESDYARNDYG
ncbi:hypothetical protein cyc_06296 [Cyclospora cayetanensis]|uniref:Uncharacterized protein n=1 Tax=Cyclospora cayetanensis TaxID=88456 RepID=A0A1D3D0X2_9EIME|nr:hypothetical protein cyc_06296 [Cyclospora cayetanensis]